MELGLKQDSASPLGVQGLLNVLQGVTAMTSLLGVTCIDLRCACMCVYARAGEYVCAFFSVTFSQWLLRKVNKWALWRCSVKT